MENQNQEPSNERKTPESTETENQESVETQEQAQPEPKKMPKFKKIIRIITIAIVAIIVILIGTSAWQKYSEEEYIGGGYHIKRNSVYFRDISISPSNDIKIKGADAETFKFLEDRYARDKNHIYWFTTVIKEADLQTFEILSIVVSCPDFDIRCSIMGIGFNVYSKDKNNIYYRGSKIGGVDLKTFEIVEYTHYSKDKKSIYYYGKKIPGADLKTFEILDISEGKDIPHMKDTYTSYSKDENNVYYKGKKFEDADPKTFEFLEGEYLKDKHHIYKNGEKLEYLDSTTFEILNQYYIKDENNVYYWSKIIKGADSATFKVRALGGAEDKDYYYNLGKRIREKKDETVDWQTYQNKVFNFEFKYPPSFNLASNLIIKDWTKEIKPGPNEFYDELFAKRWQNRLSHEGYYDNGDSCLEKDIVPITDYDIAEITCSVIKDNDLYVIKYIDPNSTNYYVIFDMGEIVFTFTEQQEDTFDIIFPSFKFIDQLDTAICDKIMEDIIKTPSFITSGTESYKIDNNDDSCRYSDIRSGSYHEYYVQVFHKNYNPELFKGYKKYVDSLDDSELARLSMTPVISTGISKEKLYKNFYNDGLFSGVSYTAEIFQDFPGSGVYQIVKRYDENFIYIVTYVLLPLDDQEWQEYFHTGWPIEKPNYAKIFNEYREIILKKDDIIKKIDELNELYN